MRGDIKVQKHESTLKNLRKIETIQKIFFRFILLLSLVSNFFELLIIIFYFLLFSRRDEQIIQRNFNKKLTKAIFLIKAKSNPKKKLSQTKSESIVFFHCTISILPFSLYQLVPLYFFQAIAGLSTFQIIVGCLLLQFILMFHCGHFPHISWFSHRTPLQYFSFFY